MKFNNLINEGAVKDFYKFETTLGKGQFGTVRKAIKKENGEEFAIKVLDKTSLTHEDVAAQATEIDILDQIDHPNVVKLIELFDEKDRFYMVFELMSGGELYNKFMERDHFSEQEVAKAQRPVVDAQRYCHTLGIAHRDLKPENLLYENNEPTATLKISDFGFARFANNDLMTTFCGTPCYVAPEIISNKPYNCSVDCWSLGVIIYLLLSGYPPFIDDSSDRLFEMIKKAEFSFPTPDWDQVSPEAKDLIRRQLVVDNTQRLSAQQIIEHPWMQKWTS